MATENIDIVVRSDTRRVVRDLNAIGSAADAAHKRVQNLQAQLNRLSSANFTRQVNQAQNAVNGFGSGHHLQQFQNAISAVTQQLQQLNAQLGRTAQASQQMSNTMGASLRGLLGPLQAVVAYLSVRQIIEWTDHWIAAAGKIRVFTESQAQANLVLEEVFNIAQKVRQPLESMAQLYTRLAIAGSELGISQGEMLKFTENVGKVLAIQGTSAMQARGALLQLAQAMGEGIVRAQEFNSLIENAPYLLKIAAQNIEGAGGSVAKLRTLMLDGKLKSREFFDAIMKGTKDIDVAFGNTRKTFSQSFTVLENAVTRFLGKLDEATGASDKFYRLAVFISENIDQIAKGILVLGSAVSAAFAPALVLRFAAALGTATVALRTLTAVLLLNPFVLLAAGATYAALFADKILIGVDHMTTLQDVFSAIKPVAMDVWTGIVEGASAFGTRIVDLAKNFTVFGANLGEEIQSWWKKFTSFFDGLDMSFAGVVQGIARVFDRLGAVLLGTASGIAKAIGSLPKLVNEIGIEMRNYMRERMEELVNSVISGINRLRALLGKDPLGFVQLQREAGSGTQFKDYGAEVAKAFKEGFDSQGGALERGVVTIIGRAQQIARERVWRELRNGERNAQTLLSPNPATAGATIDDKAAKKAAQEAARAAKQAVEDSKKEIQNLLASYRESATEMTEVERHRQVMLKASYDQGLINYRTYSTELERLQEEMHVRQRNELINQQAIILEKMNELRTKMKRAGVGDPEIANTLQALELRMQGLNGQLTKLENVRSERMAQALAQALGPANELLKNAEKETEALDLNYQQRIRQLQAVSNLNQLSEREQFILTGTNQLLDKYEDKLKQIETIRDQMAKDGVFDDLTDPAVAKAFNDLNKLITQYQQRIQQIKREAPGVLGQAFDAQQTQKLADELEKSLREGIMRGGKDGARSLRQFITDELVKKPFRIVVEAVIKPITQAISQAVAGAIAPVVRGLTGVLQNVLMGGASPAAASGGGGFMGSLLNGAGSLGSMFGAGGLGGALAAGAGWLSGSTTLMGSLGAAGSLIGTGTGSGIMSGLAMGVGALGPIALGAFALHSLFSGRRGGPKEGGSVGFETSGIGKLDQTGLLPMVQSSVQNMTRSFQQLARTFGSSAAGIAFGQGVSTDPRGTAPNMVGTTVSRNGQPIYNVWNHNGGRGEQNLQQVMNEQFVMSMAGALMGSGVQADIWHELNRIREEVRTRATSTESGMEQIQELGGISKVTTELRNLGGAFNNFTEISVQARRAVIDFAGGINEFQAGINAYMQNFFTEGERVNMQATQIANELRSIGINWMPDDVLRMTKETYRAHVQGLDLTTEWGQRAYATLIRLSGAFAQVADSAANAANASGEAALERFRRIRENHDRDLEAARARVGEAYEREKSQLTALRDNLKRTAETLRNFSNSLNFNSNLSIYSPSQQYALARSQLMTTPLASDKFPEVAKQFLEASRSMFASGEQYTADFNQVQALLGQGIRSSEMQMSNAQLQLNRLDNMVYGITRVNESIMTLSGAVREFLRIQAQGPNLNPGAYGLPGPGVQVPSGYTLVVGPDGLFRFIQSLNFGSVPDTINGILKGHAGGISNVPYNDYVFRAHRGEAVLTATEAAVWRSMQSGGTMDLTPLLRSMEALRQEVAELREQQADATRAEIVATREALAQNAKAIASEVTAGVSRESWKAKQQAEATYK